MKSERRRAKRRRALNAVHIIPDGWPTNKIAHWHCLGKMLTPVVRSAVWGMHCFTARLQIVCSFPTPRPRGAGQPHHQGDSQKKL